MPNTHPAGFAPRLFDLDSGPLGPFPASKKLTRDGTVIALPLPGHSLGQVGVLARCEGLSYLMCGGAAQYPLSKPAP
jgi:N-acyl homoserine lactone hydrolase